MLFGNRWKQVGKRLGRGGGGAVYPVVDSHSGDGTVFALKVLNNRRLLPRFRREIETLQRIRHPNVLQILFADLDAAMPYLVTEFCEAGNLTSLDLAHEEPRELLQRFMQICGGVAALHEAGGVHRDIKPENILLRRDRTPVVADFGIVFLFDETGERFTQTFEQVGSRFFICPENEEGRTLPTAACDVYSLGKLLYGMLSSGNKIARSSHRAEDNNIVTLRHNYWLEHVNALLDRMLAEPARERLQSVRDVIRATSEVLNLVDGQFNPLNLAEQRCLYCGVGAYLVVRYSSFEYYGIRPMNEHTQRVLRCPNCGHIQLFVIGIDGLPPDWISQAGVPQHR
jgi:serine/threonine protein kinase